MKVNKMLHLISSGLKQNNNFIERYYEKRQILISEGYTERLFVVNYVKNHSTFYYFEVAK